MNVVTRNNVRILGQGGPTLMFSHGFGCDQTMWARVAHRFADRARVVLFDHVGSGASDIEAYDPETYGTLSGYARDVGQICEALDLTDVTFIGHSVSATIGALASLDHTDRIGRLILVCASPRYIDTADYRGGFSATDVEELLDLLDKNTLDWSALMGPNVVGQGQAEQEAMWRDSVCRMDPRIARQFARTTFTSDHRADYARLLCPTLILDSRDDALAPPEVGAFLSLAVANSRRVILPTDGHCPHMTTPDLVESAITRFVFDPDLARAA